MEFLTVQEIAEMLKVNKAFIYGLIKEGTLPAVKIGKAFRVAKSDFEAFLKAQAVEK